MMDISVRLTYTTELYFKSKVLSHPADRISGFLRLCIHICYRRHIIEGMDDATQKKHTKRIRELQKFIQSAEQNYRV